LQPSKTCVPTKEVEQYSTPSARPFRNHITDCFLLSRQRQQV
jgi:hypothetical protein